MFKYLMNKIDFWIQGFGFINFADFKASSFGYMLSGKVVTSSGVIAFLTALADSINLIFGVNHIFFAAYVVLIIFEWLTGIAASHHRNEQHQSRKLGRMLLKIGAYSVPLYVLNAFSKNTTFPVVFGYEIDPFTWLYFTVLLVIIWQLIISVLENLDELDIPFASKLIKIINKKFYSQLDVKDDE